MSVTRVRPAATIVDGLPSIVAAAYLVQLALVAYTVFYGNIAGDVQLNYTPGTQPIAGWLSEAPIRVATHEFGRPAFFLPLHIALGLVQSIALFALYRHIRANGVSAACRGFSIGAAAVMALASIAIPAATSADAYAYVGYGLAPSLHASFDTASYALPPAFSLIGKMYGTPLPPNVYGAGFYGFMAAVVALHLPLWADLYLLRLLGAVTYAFALWLLRRRLSPAGLVTVGLCPALYVDWICDAHNDVYPVALTVVAVAFVRERAGAAIAAVALATLFKIALLAVGIGVVAARDKLVERLAIAALIVLASGAAFYVLDGPSFARVLARTALAPPANTPEALRAATAHAAAAPQAPKKPATKIRGLTLLALAAALAVALLFARASAGNAFLFAAIAPLTYPWYLCWGLAYAALSDATFAYFAIVLPTLTAYLNPDAARLFNAQYVDWGFALASAAVFAVLRLNRPVAGSAAVRA